MDTLLIEPESSDQEYSALIAYDRKNRNLEEFPFESILRLAETIDHETQYQLQLNQRLSDFINHSLNFVNHKLISEEEFNLVGHALASILMSYLEQGTPEAAAFLFEPNLDPNQETITVEGKEITAIKHFTQMHHRLVRNELSNLMEIVFEQSGVLMVVGPMFSAKTARLMMIERATPAFRGQDHLHTFVFAKMNETTIHARSFVEGSDIPAEPVDVEQFDAEADRIASLDQTEPHIVLIEEATFFDDPEQFAASIQKLVAAGIRVIISGLDRDYMTRPLPVVNAISATEVPVQTIDCTSFTIQRMNDETQIHSANRTARFLTGVSGIYDFYLPVLVPRGSNSVRYYPVPGEYHPMQTLQQVDPDLFESVSNIGREDLREALETYNQEV